MRVPVRKLQKFHNKYRNIFSEETHMFDIVLCNNDIDKDNERFTSDSLFQMAKMFSGIKVFLGDRHAENDCVGRILTCNVVTTSQKNKLGHPLLELRAKAYIFKHNNEDIIDGIVSGRIQHVSVGTAVNHSSCSICHSSDCSHVPGLFYNDMRCYRNLDDISDVYEVGIMLNTLDSKDKNEV